MSAPTPERERHQRQAAGQQHGKQKLRNAAWGGEFVNVAAQLVDGVCWGAARDNAWTTEAIKIGRVCDIEQRGRRPIRGWTAKDNVGTAVTRVVCNLM